MTRHKIILLLAVLVAVIPHLGFPRGWNTAFLTTSGIVIAVIALLSVYQQGSLLHKIQRKKNKTSDPYIENAPISPVDQSEEHKESVNDVEGIADHLPPQFR